MKPNTLFLAAPAALLLLAGGTAHAGQTITDTGAIACVVDKWDEKEPEKGHKLADYAGRCIIIPQDVAAPKSTEDCSGNYEFMPDGEWKGAGTCTRVYKSGDKWFLKWEQGSHIKEGGLTTITGGTGQYSGIKGSGTFTLEELTDTLQGGTYNKKLELP
jgi:hypothetical protein